MNLKVKIPKKFKRELSKRFNYRNRKEFKISGGFEISVKCILCANYRKPNCEKCPFYKFRSDGRTGCQIWIDEIIKNTHVIIAGHYAVDWGKSENEEAKAELSQLRLKSKELIEWI